MALVSGGRSSLNPNAPLFVPAAYRQVEDFSPEWWQLVTTSTWYHDYWLSQHQGNDGFYDNNDLEGSDDIADLLPDTFDFGLSEDFSNMESQFEEFIQFQSNESEKENKASLYASNNFQGNGADTMEKRLITSKSFDERGSKFLVQPAKYAEKPAKSASPRFSPAPSSSLVELQLLDVSNV